MTILDDARPGMDPSVRPQDDLFGHVNGRWLETEEIPSDKSRWGAFSLLAERAEQQAREIIEECAASSTTAEKATPTQQFGDLWRSFRAEEGTEASARPRSRRTSPGWPRSPTTSSSRHSSVASSAAAEAASSARTSTPTTATRTATWST